MRAIDLKGQRFGRLVVIEKTKERSDRGVFMWLCMCDCGNTIKLEVCRIKGPKAKSSCGCLHEKHGDHKERLYNIWSQMKHRCCCADNDRYGGRGISVCNEWQKYSGFKEWAVSSGYANELTIDRIDNDGNYEPGNCRWVTVKENNRNRPCVKLDPESVVEIKNLLFVENKTVASIARQYGLGTTIISNIKHGHKWSDIHAVESASKTIN